jgi:stalled ribosome rescue protein Dom34
LSFQKGYRRGYPVAVLIGLKEDQAVLWKVYSQVVKVDRTLTLVGLRGDSKAVYNFYESIVNALRPALREGVKSVVVASPPRTSSASDFLRHVKEHHTWLVQGQSKASLAEMVGAANTFHEVTVLTRLPDFKRIIGETTVEETENLLDLLEKRLNAPSKEPLVLYSIEEIEDKILGASAPASLKPEYLLLSDSCLTVGRLRNRLQRLMQVASNKGVKARVVDSKTPAGKRIIQLGGMVCILSTVNA